MSATRNTAFGQRYGTASPIEERQMRLYAARARAARAHAYRQTFQAMARGIRAALRLLGTRRESARQRRTMLRELNAMDDRFLRDIGVRRGDIPTLAARSTRRRRIHRRAPRSAGAARVKTTARLPDTAARRRDR